MSVLEHDSVYTEQIRPKPLEIPSGCILGNSLGLRPYLTIYPSSCLNMDAVYSSSRHNTDTVFDPPTPLLSLLDKQYPGQGQKDESPVTAPLHTEPLRHPAM